VTAQKEKMVLQLNEENAQLSRTNLQLKSEITKKDDVIAHLNEAMDRLESQYRDSEEKLEKLGGSFLWIMGACAALAFVQFRSLFYAHVNIFPQRLLGRIVCTGVVGIRLRSLRIR
jgi:hypothetical protein